MKEKRQFSICFSEEVFLKIQAYADAKELSFTKAVNEVVLLSSETFPLEIRNISAHSEAPAQKLSKLEYEMATIVDLLSNTNGSLEIIKNKITGGK